jgi:glutamine amidotransferase
MIAIVDYSAGNVRSVLNMLIALNFPAQIVRNGAELKGAERIILPGVGHFDHGMAQLEELGFIPVLNDMVIGTGVPLLGICLGAQLVARSSAEGRRPGLGWIPADVVAFERSKMNATLRVPHMGWAETWQAKDALLPRPFHDALPEDARFYYVHSFHLLCDNPAHAVLRAWYGYEFAAGVMRGNIMGVQFHPEKSHEFGKRVMHAFATWNPAEVVK